MELGAPVPRQALPNHHLGEHAQGMAWWLGAGAFVLGAGAEVPGAGGGACCVVAGGGSAFAEVAGNAMVTAPAQVTAAIASITHTPFRHVEFGSTWWQVPI
jgi:hypothetical protein